MNTYNKKEREFEEHFYGNTKELESESKIALKDKKITSNTSYKYIKNYLFCHLKGNLRLPFGLARCCRSFSGI